MRSKNEQKNLWGEVISTVDIENERVRKKHFGKKI